MYIHCTCSSIAAWAPHDALSSAARASIMARGARVRNALVCRSVRCGSATTVLRWPVLAMMQTRAHLDRRAGQAIVDGVRKALQQNATHITMRHGPHCRCQDHEIEGAPQLLLELSAESTALPFIPA